ncbi:hypothetical protein B0T18DRAFT_488578 [Schizothecium vesticola]|uniref:Diphthamide biosynthesis protein 4 n=1 Tax=Schizothecium vesticola TaxID=314040 RepID=A0AA40EUT9_9PEZI|nr:hypothetical protein B0T18DRAFT_488578 [Schizothecium vesticola]
MPPPTYYEILSLPPSLLPTSTTPSPSHNQLLKRAYRRALLNHHPDKTNTPTTTTPSSTTPTPKTTTYTIDQITLAYTTLSTPSLRAAYDRVLVLAIPSSSHQDQDQGYQDQRKTGLETVDLDDLSYDEDAGAGGKGEWFRACRCGNARGFRVGEEDLDEALLQ